MTVSNVPKFGIPNLNAPLVSDTRILDRAWRSWYLSINGMLPFTPLSGTFTVTWQGFSVVPGLNAFAYNYIPGVVATILIPGANSGTSNSVTFSATGVPSFLLPGVTPLASGAVSEVIPIVGLVDNGVNLAGGAATINPSNGVISFFKDGTLGSWTAAGTKGFGTGGPYLSLTWFL